MRPSLEEYALALAVAAASRAEDPHRKVGAAILGHQGEVLATGYNGTPAGAPPLSLTGWEDRDLVRDLTIHAEANALRYVRPGEGAILASTLRPCVECLKATRAQGIRDVVYGDAPSSRWDVPGHVFDFFGMRLRHLPPPIGLDDYQREAERTGREWDEKERDQHRMLLAMGLGGEAGEVLEIIKKEVGHGRAPDADHMAEELGDVLWYLAEEARLHGFTLSEVARRNIAKLRARYPDGFKELG